MKRRFFSLLILLLFLCSCAAAQRGSRTFSPRITEYEWHIPSLEREFRIVLVCDLHIVARDDAQLNEEKKEEAAARREFFSNAYGTAEEYWEQLAPMLDSLQADVILFAGDMVDYASEATLSILAEGFAQIRTPFLYVRADHDTETWYTSEHMSREDSAALHEALTDNDGILSYDAGGLRILGWNNSCNQMSVAQAQALSEAARAEDTPVLLLTHVPLKPESDTGLSERSREAWQDRDLFWGTDSYYVPDAVTAEAFSLIYDGTLPVCHILSGHLHFAYDGPLTDTCEQHVFAPAFEDHIAIITVSP
ncbi:MAG: metallophosphoesterase [Lachnospiraceae bacterium]|nr:metallophosphoesterase [Lachnospiraceae bacterium]